MTSDQIPERLRIAREVAAAAARTALSFHQQTDLASWRKDDGSVVTKADLATEEQIRRLLAERCPGEPVLGEELGSTDPTATGYWIVDPIDGTENFRRGSTSWGILVCWYSEGEVEAAAVVAPSLGRNWWAGKGLGAFTDGDRRLGVSAVEDVADSSFCFGGAHEYGLAAGQRLTAFASTCRTAWGIGNFLGHMQVAEGIADGALSFDASIWDLAAPSLIVAEAGGGWSDIAGAAELRTGSMLSANQLIHPRLLAGVQQARLTDER
jgi:histidinol-phosphatase